MFQWFSRRPEGSAPDIPRVASDEELDRLLAQDLVVLFKHSPTCGVSWAAHHQVKRFLADHPGAPVHLISVRQDREISRRVAEVTGIPHASPQIVVLRQGEAVADTSHEGITADNLTGMFASASNART
jgi:bacillithiol system protein YtxJ